MNQISKLFLLANAVLVFDAAAVRRVGVDFAPIKVWDATGDGSRPLNANGLGIGWYIKGAGQVDGRPVDYARLQTDEAYADRVQTVLADDLDSKVYNLLYKIETGISRTDLPKPKDEQGNEIAYAACYEAAGFASNHRDCDLNYEPQTQFAIFQVNFKWFTGSVVAVKFSDDNAVAWGNLTKELDAYFARALGTKFRNNRDYRDHKDDLVYNFSVRGIDRGNNANEALVTGDGSATVPKTDDFDATLRGTVKIVREGELIKLDNTQAERK